MISLSRKTKEKAVEDLLLQNYDQYYRLAYSYVHNEADSGDIVQNGAYKAIRSSSDLKEVRYAATWLYRIMLNEIFSFCKQKKTEPLEEGNDEPHYEDTYENLDLKHALELLPLITSGTVYWDIPFIAYVGDANCDILYNGRHYTDFYAFLGIINEGRCDGDED